MDKKEYLEKELGVTVTETNDDYFETEDGEEYRVLDYDESVDAVKEETESLMDDIGFDAFTPEFRDWIFQNAADEDFLHDVVREDFEFYVEDIMDDKERFLDELKENGLLEEDATVDDIPDGIEDDLVDKLTEDVVNDYTSDLYDYLTDSFGTQEVYDMIIRNNAVDIDKIVEKEIDWDGFGHFLAEYDGKEIELTDDNGNIVYYAYRWN